MGRRGSARRTSVLMVAVLGAVLGMAACGDDSEEQATTTTAPSVTATEVLKAPPTSGGAAAFTATLSGDAEIPGPGDAAGSGTARVTVDPTHREICFEITVSGIAPADKAHIHRGPTDQAGPIVVELAAPTTGRAEGCAAVDQALAQEIVAGPSGFYVNVHNGPYPAGALRGQLTI